MPGVPPTRFVYLGPEGTFSEEALRTIPAAERGTRTPARSVPEALDAVRGGDADAAVVPLENSVGGQVGVTLDELAGGAPLVITREIVLPVRFVLAAREPVDLAVIASVAAHPQASAQCRGWLRKQVPAAVVVDMLSNGAAAAAAAGGEHDAAICAPIGAEQHRLAALADAIAAPPDRMTRVPLGSRPGPPPAGPRGGGSAGGGGWGGGVAVGRSVLGWGGGVGGGGPVGGGWGGGRGAPGGWCFPPPPRGRPANLALRGRAPWFAEA